MIRLNFNQFLNCAIKNQLRVQSSSESEQALFEHLSNSKKNARKNGKFGSGNFWETKDCQVRMANIRARSFWAIQHSWCSLWVPNETTQHKYLLEIYFVAVLVLFLNLKLGYDRDTSTAIYHSYSFCVFFFPIVGSVIADSWWGQFKTLFWSSVVLGFGCIIMGVGTIEALSLPIK